MKKFLLALLSAVMFAAPAFALVGGPWDNNIPGNPTPVNPSNINGTYQGTIKGKNLSGVIRFTSSTSGQVVISSTTWHVVQSGSNFVWTSEVSTQILNTTGYGTFFFEGKTGQAIIDTAIDLGGKKLSGIINGAGSRAVSETLNRPATGDSWRLFDSVFFNGAFSAKLSSSRAANSFSGKGVLTVTKFDIIGFWQDLVVNPTTADPNNHIVTVPLTVKVAGVKTSDNIAVIAPPTITPTLPVIVPNP